MYTRFRSLNLLCFILKFATRLCRGKWNDWKSVQRLKVKLPNFKVLIILVRTPIFWHFDYQLTFGLNVNIRKQVQLPKCHFDLLLVHEV